MSVAVGPEIGIGGQAQSLGGISAGAHSSRTAAGGQESFRAGWQSLLASIGSKVSSETEGAGREVFGDEEAKSEAGTAGAEKAASALPGNFVVAAKTFLGLKAQAGQGNGPVAGGPKPAEQGTEAGSSGGHAAKSGSGQASAGGNTVETRYGEDAAGDARTASSPKTSKPETKTSVDQPLTSAATPAANVAPQMVQEAFPVPVAEPSAVPIAVTAAPAAEEHMAASSSSSTPGYLADSAVESNSLLQGIGPPAGVESRTGSPAGNAAQARIGTAALGREPAAAGARGRVESGLAASNVEQATEKPGTDSEAFAFGNLRGAAEASTHATSVNRASIEVPAAQVELPRAATEASGAPDSNNSSDLGAEEVNAAASQFTAGPAGTVASGQAEARRAGAVTATRTGSETGTADEVQAGGHTVAVQQAGLNADGSALVRDGSVAHGPVNLPREGTASGSGTAGSRDTFAALDGGDGAGTSSWIHAGSRSAEAGFEDPLLGWVGVRADLSGGAVHAAVVTASAEAAQALGGHMAGLNSYLAERHTGVETVTLATPQGANSGAISDASEGMQQGNGQSAGQGGPSERGALAQPRPAAIAGPESGDRPASVGEISDAAPSRLGLGMHISVMA